MMVKTLAPALESFFSQLDDRCEMVMGIEKQDHAIWTPIFNEWHGKYPLARFQVVAAPRPSGVANPKIAWQMQLAPLATGKLWLWSDADIIAPSNFLRTVCSELEGAGTRALTSPYVVRAVERAEGIPDALFVNLEFFPGVLLLKKRGTVSFALGAATLFHADEFRKKVDWQKLGESLADDFELGKALEPVTIGHVTVETLPDQKSWRKALLHYLRWHKTVRWCQPSGYAAQIAVLPMLGWLLFAWSHPLNPVGWLGLLLTSQMEVGVALWICHRVNCRIPVRWWWVIEGWTMLRPLVWVVSWLPLSVSWGRQKWRTPVQFPSNPVLKKD